MSSARALVASGDRITPIFRKTGSKVLGADAFEHARDIEDAVYRELPLLLGDLERAREALFKCYEASGADTDGAHRLSDMGRLDPPIEVLAVRAVEELRRDYDEDAAGP